MWIDHEGAPFKSDDDAEEAVALWIANNPDKARNYVFKGKHNLVDSSGDGKVMKSRFLLVKTAASASSMPESGNKEPEKKEEEKH